MNTRPTPETDAYAVFPSSNDDSDTPSPNGTHVDADYARRLKRERDEARAEMIRWMFIAEGWGRMDDDDTGKAMANLIRERDQARRHRDILVAALRRKPKEKAGGGCPSTPCLAWLPIITAPNSLNVILVTDGEDVWTDQKLGGNSGVLPGDYYFNGHENWEEVTHWMPIPSLPNVKDVATDPAPTKPDQI